MRRVPQMQSNSRVRRQRDVLAFSRLALLLFCGVVLTCGFVFAAKQHFAAVNYGYENENLRRERQRLMEERKRLMLEKEQASAPAKLEPAARRLGLKPATSAQIGSAILGSATAQAAK
jgi:cell division protein FtsL